jgi:hypothetical protein
VRGGAWSLLLGTFSHLVIDLLSHGDKHAGFNWLRPLDVKVQIFPGWWNHTWFTMPVPGYENGYPFAPHFVVWVVLGVLGTVMLFAPAFRAK